MLEFYYNVVYGFFLVFNCLLNLINFFFFFFQAEDGIRDVAVTGVQTCALPIYVPGTTNEALWNVIRVTGNTAVRYPPGPDIILNNAANTFTVNNVSVYSDWTAGEPLAPTAANSSVSGRVLNEAGRGVAGAQVMMQNHAGNVVWAMTNPFGYYRFVGVPTGQTYLIAPRHKWYEFQPRTIAVNDDLTGLDFMAEP